jgi:hypothetical protein
MRSTGLLLALALGLGASGCSGCNETPNEQFDAPPDVPDAAPPFNACDGDSDSFTRQAMLGLVGRRPLGQAEVDVYNDLFAAAEAQGADPRRAVATAILGNAGYVDRWVEQLADHLAVQRIDIQGQAACWGPAMRGDDPGPSLAMTVRDQLATGTGDGAAFSMRDLARSSIQLDDLTPMLRGQVFAMMASPIPAANVPPVEAELARRDDFGATFDSAYLHRDMVCLGCHNSEGSVTDSDDPVLDRHWPVAGYPELAVYGQSNGIDPDRAHAVFRVDDFVFAGNKRPWNWSNDCGRFASSVTTNDPAGIDGKLASLTGQRLTVFDLDGALRRGFEALRGIEPPLDGTGHITDPDAALAWLVVLSTVEDVWREVVGTRLTVANYFPRNQPSAEMLHRLGTTFTTSGYSLRALLVEIVASEYFNRKPPELACGAGPYNYPNVYDPWVISDSDETRRLNGAGDAIAPLGPRTLLTAAQGAMEWPADDAARFPDFGESGCAELSCAQAQNYCDSAGICCVAAPIICAGADMPLELQRGIGVYLRNSEAGFRGLDFQARLTWEKSYGACYNLSTEDDFIDTLVAAAAGDPAATVEELVLAVKDRMIGEPLIVDEVERTALAAVLGVGLDQPASAVAEDKLRRVCGVLLQSPQFLMQGMAGRGGERPRLTPASAGYDTVCASLVGRDIGIAGQVVSCTAGELALVAGRIAPKPERPRVVREPTRRPKGLPPKRTPAPLTAPKRMR